MRALDVISTRTIWNQSRIIDFVAELVVEVSVVGEVGRIDSSRVDDIEHAARLANRIRGQQVGNTHTCGGRTVRGGIAHPIARLFQAGAGSEVFEMVLAEAAVHRRFAVRGKDHSQSDGGNQYERK